MEGSNLDAPVSCLASQIGIISALIVGSSTCLEDVDGKLMRRGL